MEDMKKAMEAIKEFDKATRPSEGDGVAEKMAKLSAMPMQGFLLMMKLGMFDPLQDKVS